MKQYLDVQLTDLEPDPLQPRKDFEETALNELAASIAAVGVIQAITIRTNPNGTTRYMIVAGERRWRASAIAGKDTIPAVLVSDLEKDQIYQQQLTENLFREDLNPVEKAEFIDGRITELRERGAHNAVELVAAEIGVTTSWVSKNTAVLRFAEELRAVVRAGKLRKYELLQKIDKLPVQKKQEAIRQINSGEFKEKEFFKRKRYDNKKPVIVESEESAPTEQEVGESTKAKAFTVKLNLTKQAFIKLVRGTEYGLVASSVNQEWDKLPDNEFQNIVDGFKDWIAKS